MGASFMPGSVTPVEQVTGRVSSPDLPPLDDWGYDVVRLAAELGAATSDDVFVSYTTLLIALVLADTPLARLLRDGIAAGRVPWALDKMLERHGPDRAVAERIAIELPKRASAPWPSGRPTLSISAQNVLAAAVEAARRRGAANPSDLDILTAYLFRASPKIHEEEVRAWSLAPTRDWFPPFADSVRPLYPKLPPAWEDTLSAWRSPDEENQREDPNPGTAARFTPHLSPEDYDEPVATILRRAIMLAYHGGDPRGVVLGSGALLVAIAEGAEGGEAGLLRGFVTSDRNRSAYERARDSGFKSWSDAKTRLTDVGDWPRLTKNAQSILQAARDFAARTGAPRPLGLRHLVVAELVHPDGTDRVSIAEWLAEDELPRAREALARLIGDHHPHERAFWREMLVGSERPFVTEAVADTVPDDPRDADALGLRRYADAIGALIARSDQQLPLSIAVFGPWGSGKSFFMRMIRAAIRDFIGNAAQSDTGGSLFVKRIAQIEFNAWHYVEGNLWASLVHAVLEALQKELSLPGADATPFHDLLSQLSLREAAEAAAHEQLRQAQQRQAEAKAALDEAAKQARIRDDALQAITASDVLGVFRAEALGRLRPAGDEKDAKAWIKSIATSVSKAADYLGRPELSTQLPALQMAATDDAAALGALQVQIGQVQDVLNEAGASARQGTALMSWLARAKFAPFTVAATVGAAILAFAALLAGALVLERYGARIVAVIVAVTSVLAPAAGGLAALATWARKHVAEASGAFAVLDGLRQRVEAARDMRLAEHHSELAAAQRAMSEAEAERARREADFKAAQAAADQARQELKASGTAEQMKRFVGQRLADGDYLRHLGLVHVIRGDMEQLGRLLNQVQPKGEGMAPPIERIVLYIDDLDRCPPARVVEVLEAVHLLLAFPLFVVVVGVDIRWVSQALQQRYPQQLAGEGGIASPLDYLEKVFQIPFWLPAMDRDGSINLLRAAIGGEAPRRGGPIGPAPPPDPPPQEEGGAALTPKREAAVKVQAEQQAADASPRPALPSPGSEAGSAVADALVLTQGERDAVLEMAGAIGISPRRAKRFANLYRLLKASLSAAERRHFVLEDGAGGSYRGALVLLATATGAPSAARQLLRRLIEPPAGAAAADPSAQLAAAVAGIEPRLEERAAFAAACKGIAGADNPEQLLGHLRLWAPRVARFVFQGVAD